MTKKTKQHMHAFGALQGPVGFCGVLSSPGCSDYGEGM